MQMSLLLPRNPNPAWLPQRFLSPCAQAYCIGLASLPLPAAAVVHHSWVMEQPSQAHTHGGSVLGTLQLVFSTTTVHPADCTWVVLTCILTAPADLLGITAGPLNTLHRHDPQSGVGLWTLQLDSPAVAVHLADGTSLKLHGPDASAARNASSVVVGSLQGSLYALPVPADWLQSTLPAAAAAGTPALSAAPDHPQHPEELPRLPMQAHSHPMDEQRQRHEAQRLSQQHVGTSSSDVSRQTGKSMLPSNPGSVQSPKMSSSFDRPDAAGARRQTGGAGQRSTALMQLPARPAEGSQALLQCPTSMHSIVTSTTPQSFLPNLTSDTTGSKAVQASGPAERKPLQGAAG